MLAEYSFSIAPTAGECDESQFSLRALECLTWNRLIISPVSAVLLAEGNAAPNTSDTGVQQKEALRDELCDLLDALSSLGIQVPLTLVVSCEEAAYEAWHRLAGEQSWIRGTFFLEPFTEAAFRNVGVLDAGQYAKMLTDIEATHVSNYRLETISDTRYLELVSARLKDEKNASVRVLAGYVIDAFKESGTMRAGDRVGQGRVDRAVVRWMNQEVLSRAVQAVPDSSTSPTNSTSSGDGQ